MEIKIEGNPGTGNHYTEVKIDHIENNFPNVTEVKIIKGPDGQKTTVMSGGDDNSNSDNASAAAKADKDKEAKREDILRYVGKTLPLVMYDWKDKYMALWADILAIPAVDAVIYKKGRQQKTSFNRKEVLHIICYLGKHANGGIGIFEDKYVATNVALLFKDGCEKTTRPELGYQPSMTVRKAIDKLIKSKKYNS